MIIAAARDAAIGPVGLLTRSVDFVRRVVRSWTDRRLPVDEGVARPLP